MRTCPTCLVECEEAAYGRSFYCKKCMAARARARRKANPEKSRNEWRSVPKEKRKEQFARWYRSMTPEERKARRKAKYAARRDRELEKSRRYKLENRGKIALKSSEFWKKNAGLNRYHRSQRRAAEKQATPSWANREAMLEFYKEAVRLTELTGIEHHVDHIIPLQSPWVCGLHCEANLQILPYYENQSKSNRIWPDMPDLAGCSPLDIAA